MDTNGQIKAKVSKLGLPVRREGARFSTQRETALRCETAPHLLPAPRPLAPIRRPASPVAAPSPYGMIRRALKSAITSVIMSRVSIISVKPKRLAFTVLIMLSQPRANTVSA